MNKTVLVIMIILGSLAVFYVGQQLQQDQPEIAIAEESGPILSKMERKKAARMAKFDQEIEMTKDPALGYVPFERLLKAQEYTHQLIERDKKQRGAIPGINWVNEGPNNVGGRTRAILFDPNDNVNNQVVFAGAVSGGLWKNTDITNSASSWTKINDFLDNLTITSLVADPQNSMIFYVGTGEAYSAVTPGLGVFKSTDGGTTWSQVPNTTDYKYISEVLVRVEGGISVLYVASKRNWVGIDGPTDVFPGKDGLFRSADGGTTWTQVIPLNDDTNVPGVDDIGLDADGNLWAATGRNADGNKGGDIFRCTDGTCDVSGDFVKKYDASANTFTNVARTVMALAPSDANTVYAVAAKEGGKEDIVYLISSTDAGMNWTSHAIPYNIDPLTSCEMAIVDQHFTNGQGTYDLCMTVHPTAPGQVLLGGIDVYRTLDGFMTSPPAHIGSWTNGGMGCEKIIHADHHTFVYRPGNPNHVAFGNDGGVWFSVNAGDAMNGSPDFTHHVKDYNVSQLYAADISPTAGAAEYLGGLQDNGTQDWDAANGQMTTEANGGDGSFCHIDQDEPMIQISSYIYNDYGVTTDEWAVPMGYTQVTPVKQSGRFINPTDYDDMNNVLYAASGVDMICRVTDIGNTNALVDSNVVGGVGLGGAQASTFRVDRNTPTTLYVGSSSGYVVKITGANTGAFSSTDISPPVAANSYISSIDVQLGNSDHLLVTVSSYGVAHVWESTDAGMTWNNVNGNFPDMPARWGIFSPNNTDHALLATDLGIWSTDNLDGASTNWAVTNAGLANVRVDMIKYRTSDKKMVAATFGRGLYTATISAVPCPPALTVTDNPAVGLYAAANTVESNPGVPIQVTTNATFQAGTSVALNTLFEVVTGAIFEAKIAGCP